MILIIEMEQPNDRFGISTAIAVVNRGTPEPPVDFQWQKGGTDK